MQVPHIKITQAHLDAAADQMSGYELMLDFVNKVNSIALAEQSQEQPLISAEEARELGMGRAESYHPDLGDWAICQASFNYLTEANGAKYLYRAIKQEPVEPTCQVRNEDTGELKTMTREKAKLLQAELGDTVDWSVDNFKQTSSIPLLFELGNSIYTYKRKASLVKLNGKLMSRESAIAEYDSKKDTCDLWVKHRSGAIPCVGPLWHCFEKRDQHEYELRERPLKQIEWAGSREDVIALLKEKGLL